MTIITIRNDFHDSTATLRISWSADGSALLSRRQVQRAKRALCGARDCACGGVLGCRGRQTAIFAYSMREDGSCEIWRGGVEAIVDGSEVAS